MKNSHYQWGYWQDAYCKFGYGDGDGMIHTPEIAAFLERHGYRVLFARWGCHNVLIYSVIKNCVEIMPHDHPRYVIGYHRPELYLPANLVTLLASLHQPQ